MRIGEIAEITGLSISNIRFYEKKGLIGPNRDPDSKYRNYSEEDLKQLQKIILYRKMDLSVEAISSILEGEISLEETLENQLKELRMKQEMLQGSIDLCQKIIDDKAFDNMNVVYYIDYVKEEEAKGKLFANVDEFLSDFTNFTQFDRIMGGSRFGFWIFKWPWVNRLVMIVWAIICIGLPVIAIAEELFVDEEPSVFFIGFWVIFLVIFITGFFKYRAMDKDRYEKKD